MEKVQSQKWKRRENLGKFRGSKGIITGFLFSG